MKKMLNVFAVAALSAGLTACSSSVNPVSPSSAPSAEAASGSADTPQPAGGQGAQPAGMTIVEIVVQDDGEFDVLQAAVIRAGLAEALSGPRQLTVFAPTDAAFVKTLGVANEEAALEAVNGLDVETLTDILLFHVTSGRRISASVLGAPRYQMLNGDVLARETLVAAGLAATDIPASNGIIHVIESVLIPSDGGR
jgi:uncharacterized surface protein with fasciclin (FAS1) repeats